MISAAKVSPAFPVLVRDFFLGYLTAQKGVSPRTIEAYRDALRLLFAYAESDLKKLPTITAKLACMPPMGSHGPRGTSGSPEAKPVTQAIPDICSTVCANPSRPRHGPSSPNAGIRIITAFGFSSWTASQSSPQRSRTRGV